MLSLKRKPLAHWVDVGRGGGEWGGVWWVVVVEGVGGLGQVEGGVERDQSSGKVTLIFSALCPGGTSEAKTQRL